MKKKRNKNMKVITILLFITVTLVWIVLLCVKSLIWGINGEELADDIISNILGILPPMILFNFLYEYLTKEHLADDMAEQITHTIMGNPQVLDAFKREEKVAFVKNTISSIVDDGSTEMVNSVVMPYITNQYNIRDFFKYTIVLRPYTNSKIFGADRYLGVYEDLKYRKLFTNGEPFNDKFHIAFILKNHELDLALRNRTYLFQESLSIDENEMEQLLELSSEEQLAFVKNEMKISVLVDDQIAEIVSVMFSENGIDIEYFHHGNGESKHYIEVSFVMPQKKGRGEFFVSINEPTYSPVIQLSYPQTDMIVKAYSFLNDGDESSLERATHGMGLYEFCIQGKWIYPMSGVVFTIDDNYEEKNQSI